MDHNNRQQNACSKQALAAVTMRLPLPSATPPADPPPPRRTVLGSSAESAGEGKSGEQQNVESWQTKLPPDQTLQTHRRCSLASGPAQIWISAKTVISSQAEIKQGKH